MGKPSQNYRGNHYQTMQQCKLSCSHIVNQKSNSDVSLLTVFGMLLAVHSLKVYA